MTEKNEKKKDSDKIKFGNFKDALDNLDEHSTQIEIEKIFKKVPVDDVVLEDKILKAVNEKTKLGKSNINRILKQVREDVDLTPLMVKLLNIQKRNPENEYVMHDVMVIEVSDEINIIELDKNNPGNVIRSKIAGFGIEFLWYTLDKQSNNVERYGVIAGKKVLNNCTVEEFIKIQEGLILRGNFGKDIIRVLFMKARRTIREKKPKYILGFKNGWYLPVDEDKENYMIIAYTDEQRNVLRRCKKMYKEYPVKEKNDIKKKMNEFVRITQIPKDFLHIILAYCIIAPFKLSFMEKFGLFPNLILEGTKHTGKTAIIDFFGNYFYKHYKEHMSGQTAKSMARFEDTISSSTFPRVIDEFNGVSVEVIDMLKEMATSVSDYRRKTSATTQFSRPKITPLIITSNDIGVHFNDSANSSRAITLNFKVTIQRDNQWVKLKNELRRKKLFSLVYDYTKDWKNKEVIDLVERAIEKIITRQEKKSWKMKKFTPSEIVLQRYQKVEKDYPRILEIFQIILAGAQLFEEVFGVKLDTNEFLSILVGSRRELLTDLIDKFFIFCDNAIMYDPTDPEARSHKYLNHRLEERNVRGKPAGEFVFTQDNLHDFNTYNQFLDQKKYRLRELGNLLEEALEVKDLVRYKNVRFKSVVRWAIVIKMDFIKGRYRRIVIPTDKKITKEELKELEKKREKEEADQTQKELERHRKWQIEMLMKGSKAEDVGLTKEEAKRALEMKKKEEEKKENERIDKLVEQEEEKVKKEQEDAEKEQLKPKGEKSKK